MKRRDIVVILIKGTGLAILLRGTEAFLDGLMVLKGYLTLQNTTVHYWMIWGIIQALTGFFLLKARTPLGWAFPQDSDEREHFHRAKR